MASVNDITFSKLRTHVRGLLDTSLRSNIKNRFFAESADDEDEIEDLHGKEKAEAPMSESDDEEEVEESSFKKFLESLDLTPDKLRDDRIEDINGVEVADAPMSESDEDDEDEIEENLKNFGDKKAKPFKKGNKKGNNNE